MLQKPLSYLLILLTLSSGFTKLYFYIGYELNKPYIATTLCENISKPELKCNGKCYLAKKIKIAEKAEQNPQKTTSKRFVNDNFLITAYRFKAYKNQIPFLYHDVQPIYVTVNTHSVFHPPQA